MSSALVTERTAFDAYERRLLTAPALSLEYHALADGPLAAELDGSLSITSHTIDLRAEGHLGPARIFVRLHADATRLFIRGSAASRDVERPADLNGGLTRIFTRLGLFHLLVRLARADPPPLGGAQVARWLRIEPIAVVAGPEAGELAKCDGYVLLTRIAGGEAGTATLWAERASGAPRERAQTLRLPHEQLLVSELYRSGSHDRAW